MTEHKHVTRNGIDIVGKYIECECGFKTYEGDLEFPPNTTPTTLRETLLKVWDEGYRAGFEKHGVTTEIPKATQSIQEQLKALLPKKRETETITGEPINLSDYGKGINDTIDQIEEAIEEWAK